MTTATSTDAQANFEKYTAAVDALRTWEATFAALLADVSPDPRLATFDKPFSDWLRSYWEKGQAKCAEVAEQAETVRDSYAAHREVSGWVGPDDCGVECSCGTTFSAPTRELLDEVADRHFGGAA